MEERGDAEPLQGGGLRRPSAGDDRVPRPQLLDDLQLPRADLLGQYATLAGTTLVAIVPAGGVERGLTALFTEIERVARFGFTATELNRQRLNLQRGLQNAVVEKDKSPSRPLADEFVRNFIHGEPIPGIVYEYGLNQRFLPQITLAEVNSLAKAWLPDRNRLVVISASMA